MVAPHHQRSSTARSSRRREATESVPRTGQRPRLRLVVDNTASAPGHELGVRPPRPVVATAMAAEPVSPVWSISEALLAWCGEVALLAEARFRLTRQRLVNRHGGLGMGRRLGELAPLVGLCTLVIFGALFALRLAQESSSSTPAAGVSVAAGVAPAAVSFNDVIAPGSAVDPAAETSAGSAVVVVHPGDSLWSIAVERFPQHDPRQVVDAFVDLNGSSAIQSGQQLVVPESLVAG